MVYPRDALVGSFGLSRTFMLGIWHGGDWMKRYLAQPIYGQVECDSPILGWIFH